MLEKRLPERLANHSMRYATNGLLTIVLCSEYKVSRISYINLFLFNRHFYLDLILVNVRSDGLYNPIVGCCSSIVYSNCRRNPTLDTVRYYTSILCSLEKKLYCFLSKISQQCHARVTFFRPLCRY